MVGASGCAWWVQWLALSPLQQGPILAAHREGPRNQTNLLYEPDNERRGWGLVMVLTVLVVRRVLMVMVLVKVMAARAGEPSVQCPSVPPCDGEPDWGATVRHNIC